MSEYKPAMSEREFWIIARRALLLIVSAIEQRYKLGKYSDGKIQEVGERDSLAI
jgi:hypothetical protein